MDNKDTSLNGLRLLVVEDQMLVAAAICDAVEDCGCRVVGPAAGLQKALKLANENELDGAVLDVNLAGDMSFPLAELLVGRGVPVLFLTGYDDSAFFPANLRSVPRVQKPFDIDALTHKMQELFANDRQQRHAG